MMDFILALFITAAAGFLLILTPLMMIIPAMNIHFLLMDIRKHPVLDSMFTETLKRIAEREGIPIYSRDLKEMNAGREEKDRALGFYICVHNENLQEFNSAWHEIDELEKEYKMPIEKICELVHHKVIRKEDYIMPRIEIAEEYCRNSEYNFYYTTLAHELGHHFAIKDGFRTEEDADRYASKLIRENLPLYFLLINSLKIKFAKGQNKLTFKEKTKAYYQYLLYYIRYGKKVRNK